MFVVSWDGCEEIVCRDILECQRHAGIGEIGPFELVVSHFNGKMMGNYQVGSVDSNCK